MKPHEKLDHPPPEGNRNVIYNSADKIKKRDESQLNVHQLVRKHKLIANKEAPIVCSRDGQLKLQKEQWNSSNEQSNVSTCTRNKGYKNCQAEKGVNMCSKKPIKDMQFRKPVATGKNCKATICGNTYSKSQSTVKYVCSDKNCQESKRPKKPRNVMWSVTNTDVQLSKPAVPCGYSRLSSEKNCQSTRCYSLKKKWSKETDV